MKNGIFFFFCYFDAQKIAVLKINIFNCNCFELIIVYIFLFEWKLENLEKKGIEKYFLQRKNNL